MIKFNNKDTVTTIGVALVSFLLTLNIFHTIFWCFYCQLCTCKYKVLTSFDKLKSIDLFSAGIPQKIDILKGKKINGYISKTRKSSESKLKYSESSFNFLQICVVFCTLYWHEYTAGGSFPYHFLCCCQRLAALKELKMIKNVFCFMLKALFVFEIFIFLVLTFWLCKKTV